MGAEWERQRLEGTREPALRTDKIEKEKVRSIGMDRTQSAELVREALATPKTRVPTARSRGSRERALAAKRRRAQLKQRRGRIGDHES